MSKESPSRTEWERAYSRSVKRTPERRDAFETSSQMPVEPLYDERNTGEPPGYPGLYPFTRGVQPAMYRSRLWTMRQYSGFGSAAETNRRFRYLLGWRRPETNSRCGGLSQDPESHARNH